MYAMVDVKMVQSMGFLSEAGGTNGDDKLDAHVTCSLHTKCISVLERGGVLWRLLASSESCRSGGGGSVLHCQWRTAALGMNKVNRSRVLAFESILCLKFRQAPRLSDEVSSSLSERPRVLNRYIGCQYSSEKLLRRVNHAMEQRTVRTN